MEYQAGKHQTARKAVAHKGLADVEATLLRLLVVGNVPLARVTAEIAGVVHAVTQQRGTLLDVGEVVHHTVLVGIKPRHHAGAGGGADGGRGIRVAEFHALSRKLVNVRGLADIIHSIGADRIHALLVRQNQQYIFALCHEKFAPFQSFKSLCCCADVLGSI